MRKVQLDFRIRVIQRFQRNHRASVAWALFQLLYHLPACRAGAIDGKKQGVVPPAERMYITTAANGQRAILVVVSSLFNNCILQVYAMHPHATDSSVPACRHIFSTVAAFQKEKTQLRGTLFPYHLYSLRRNSGRAPTVFWGMEACLLGELYDPSHL